MLPRSAEKIRETIIRNSKLSINKEPLSKGHKGAIIGNLNEHLRGDNNRHLVLGWIFKSGDTEGISTKELSNSDWHALNYFIDSYKEGGEWKCAENFPVECGILLTRALKDYKGKKAKIRATGLYPDYMVEDAVNNLDGVVTAVGNEEKIENEKGGKLLKHQRKIASIRRRAKYAKINLKDVKF